MIAANPTLKMALVAPNGEGPSVIAGLDPAIHPSSDEDGPPKSGLPDFGLLSAQVGINPTCVVKPRVTRESRQFNSANGVQRFPGIAIRLPAASGRGRLACDAFMRASPLATSSGKGAVLPAVMSTWSDMFSDVAATQPSSAWKSCSKKCMRLAS